MKFIFLDFHAFKIIKKFRHEIDKYSVVLFI